MTQETADITITELGESAAIIKTPGARYNIVTFAGLRATGGYGIPVYEFIKTLSRLDANVLFIRDTSTRWYNFGLAGFSSSPADTAKTIIKKIKSEFSCLPLICIGNSMGGYAALLFGELLRAELVVAICPQTFIDKTTRIQANDSRWAEQLDKFTPAIPDLRRHMQGKLGKARIILGDRCVEDLLHTGNISTCPKVSIEIIKGANHDVARKWKDEGTLVSNFSRLISFA